VGADLGFAITGSNGASVYVTRGPENTMILLLCEGAGDLLRDDSEVYCFTNTLKKGYGLRQLVTYLHEDKLQTTF
jgi:hypothetical protein